MKKIFLLIVILLQVGFLSAQERDNVGHRVGPWNFGTPQQGITWKIRRSYYSDNSEKFTNEIEIKNINNSTVTFSYNISENANETTTRYRKTLSPNGTYTSTYCPNAESVYFYVELSNGQTNNSNQQTQQNDLSDYNRSKADLERQMAEKNAEITRQNQENTNKLNIWNNAIKAGVDAHNSGNYTEAKNQFTIAMNNSTNESNRQNAQNYYNKSVEAEKSQAKIKAVGDLGHTIISGIQEQKEWSAEQKRLKAERLKQAEDYMRSLEQKFIDEINLADNGDIDKQNWVAYQFYDKQKYESAEEYYKMVMSNKDDAKITQRESSSNYLASCYAINGKFLDQWNELNKKDKYGNFIFYNKFQRAMLILFSKDYEINTIVSDEMKKLAIQDLKNEKPDYHSKVVLAYFQVTGEYESLGIKKNEKEGLEILTKSTYSELASFFIGDLYLKGIVFKKDDKKAFDNFLNVVKLNKNQKIIKKFNVNSKSDLDFYKPIPNGLHNIYQLTPLIMAYSKIAIILEKSSKDSDRNLLKYKSEFLEWYGNLLNIEDRTFWKIKINQNPFLQTEKK